MNRIDLSGRPVTVIGLGRHGGGVGVVQYLARQGAKVTVTDLADADRLAASLKELAGLPIARYRLGEHRAEDFCDTDLLVVNPAVLPGNPYVALARAAGVLVTTEIELFMAVCPSQIIGVTGTDGKSTTAAMITAILQRDGRRTFLGGNLGGSLLDDVAAMDNDDWVVLELSSFQLASLGDGMDRLVGWVSQDAQLPRRRAAHADRAQVDVAVVTGCTPHHLDWHGTYAAYVADKQRLLTGQRQDSLAVLNGWQEETLRWTRLVRGHYLPLVSLAEVPCLRVLGGHNRVNAALAATAALGIGCASQAVETGLAQFSGLPHRLERFGSRQGRHFYNDSMATTPTAAMAGLTAMERPTWLLAGGYDKGADFEELADLIVNRAQGVSFYGAARNRLCEAVRCRKSNVALHTTEHLQEAMTWCWRRSRSGDVLLLSPACASFDQYSDYVERGTHFQQLIEQLPPRVASEPVPVG